MALRVRPLAGPFGAEIIGVDLLAAGRRRDRRLVEAAWSSTASCSSAACEMTPAQHVAFTRKLGPLHIMEPLEFNLPGYPEVLVVSNVEKDNKPIGMKRAVGDGTPMAKTRCCRTPARSSTRSSCRRRMAIRCTPIRTLHLSALPDDVRRKIMGRRACFSRARFHEVYYPHLPPLTDEQKKARPDVWHPIARRHPHSGWTSLYIGRWAYKIDGMPDAEAQELIDYLKDFATRPEFVYRHKWRVGDALLWDNRCAQHCADTLRRREISAPHAAHDSRRRSPDHGGAASVSPGTGSWSEPFQEGAGSTRQFAKLDASHTLAPVSNEGAAPSFGVSTRPRWPASSATWNSRVAPR
jgi:taurine dioxygenase/putative 2-oxoglutarate oxygenase